MDTTIVYVKLIKDFLEHNLSGSDFEIAFIKQRRSDLIKKNKYNKNIEDLFFDIDSFCSDAQLIETGDITEEQLREKCFLMLEILEN
ncbi:colicin immunity domain-containing protein [Desulfovibrio sp. Huiquan2017]|uniref:colicin immunity domain-containing protein n=1 Tax=Desulfovibrio sp. Huiquan2017 TaxID=2816861 RepID=UPI001A91A374|nr:colicin immunity domain-containing protein [Desulfovibrio sp. Huiquan2017]